ALMTELLELSAKHRVLEVGTGSGYQAAVLAEIVRDVFSVEIYEQLHVRAQKNLGELGYQNVHLRHGDGARGWKEHGPYDAIIVTCASTHIPPALVEQLRPGGRMCIPVGAPFGLQRLLLVDKQEGGKVTTRTITQVRFVPLLSRKQVPEAREPKKPPQDP
ncbi:MAG: protein-L-isoaspartate O-methyltransferase, partial [Planctomycetota bacterium]